MTLTRKVRRSGRSLAVTIPGDLASLYDLKEGDQAEFEPLGDRTFRIKLVKGDASG